MAQQDDSAYQQNPYGMTNPTQLFQQLSTQNQDRGAMGQISQGAMQAGFNPQMQQAQQIQQTMAQILGQVGPPQDNEDPIDYQMRQAKAMSTGLASVSPMMAMNADQQMLRLQNAKDQQNKLSADTQYEKSETAKNTMATAQAAADPIVMVKQGKDSFGLPQYSTVGNPVSMFDEQGGVRTGWSNDVQEQSQANPGSQPMRQSQYLSLVEKTNEGKNLVAMMAAQQRMQMMMGSTMSPDAVSSYATQVRDGLAPPMQPPVNTRNPAAIQNYNSYVAAMRQLGEDPGAIDATSFKNNTTQLNAFNHGPQADFIRSLNVAVQHADLLKQYFTAQQNNDMPAQNWVENKWADMTGQPIPKTTDAMKDFVADEWTKGIVGQRPALGDRIGAQDKISRNSSPAQFNQVMDGWIGLGSGQLNGLKTEFAAGLKKGNGESFDPDKVNALWYGDATHAGKVAPETRAIMERSSHAPGAINGPPSLSAKPGTGESVTMLAPDGKTQGTVKAGDVARLKASGYTMVQQ